MSSATPTSVLYGFGLCQEDSRIDAVVLGPAPGRRLLCIASGGEGALGLVARGAAVRAVDIDLNQLHLVHLKLAAALTLPAAEAAGFLGYATRDRGRRRQDFATVREQLPTDARAFWDAHMDAVERGALWSGRFERFLQPVMGVIRRVWGRRHVDALCRAEGGSEQEALFERFIGRPWVRGAFWTIFHPRVYGGRGLDAEALAQRTDPTPLGEQFYGWFRALCTSTPAADNWFLHVALRGGLVDPERGPDFLRPAGVRALREGPGSLTLVHGDLEAVLEKDETLYDGASVSNLGDWLDADRFAALLRAVADHVPDGAPVLWRELQTVREPPPDLALDVDRARGQGLRATDRFPFYRVVPAIVRPADG